MTFSLSRYTYDIIAVSLHSATPELTNGQKKAILCFRTK